MNFLEKIAELARTGSVRHMPHLLFHLRDPTHEHAGAAARAVESILSRASVRELIWLDGRYRHHCLLPVEGTAAWYSPTTADIDRWAPHSWGVLALASLDANGFARERAVQRLGERTEQAILPFIVFRLNDWVVPVRRAASAVFSARLARATAEDLIALAPSVENLMQTTRHDHLPLRGAFHRRLQFVASTEAFRIAIRSRDPMVARSVAAAICELPAERACGALISGAMGADPATARICADALRRDTPGSPVALVDTLIRSPHAVVRVRALEIAHESLPSETAMLVLRRGVHDGVAQVREFARFALTKRGVTEFREDYRRALAAAPGSVPFGSVRGLAEIAEISDFALLSSLCDARDSRVREAALRGCIRLDAARSEANILAVLDDRCSAVRSLAWSYLHEHPILEEGELLSRVARATTAGSLVRVLRVIECATRWRAIELLLRAHAVCAIHLRERVASRLMAALRTAGAPTSRATAELVRQRETAAQLDARTLALLEEVLKRVCSREEERRNDR